MPASGSGSRGRPAGFALILFLLLGATVAAAPCTPPLIVRLPGTTTLLARPGETVAPLMLPVPGLARFRVPWFTTVPPE